MIRLNRISTEFVTELIDIITPELQGIDSKNTAATNGSFDDKSTHFQIEDEVISLCLVFDFMDTDLD
jgi:hypothetical protein